MPLITIETTPLSKEKKEQMIQGCTKVVSEATGLPASTIIVVIHEPPADNFGVGGEQLSRMHH